MVLTETSELRGGQRVSEGYQQLSYPHPAALRIAAPGVVHQVFHTKTRFDNNPWRGQLVTLHRGDGPCGGGGNPPVLLTTFPSEENRYFSAVAAVFTVVAVFEEGRQPSRGAVQ